MLRFRVPSQDPIAGQATGRERVLLHCFGRTIRGLSAYLLIDIDELAVDAVFAPVDPPRLHSARLSARGNWHSEHMDARH
jgi:hypothetical protein